MTDAGLRRYVALVAINYQKELKKKEKQILDLKEELRKYKCASCKEDVGTRFAACGDCKYFICSSCSGTSLRNYREAKCISCWEKYPQCEECGDRNVYSNKELKKCPECKRDLCESCLWYINKCCYNCQE